MQPLTFTDTTLDNGLRVIIAEDHYAPVYALAISYKVGSRDERQGRTGFAHLFEHMMFKARKTWGPASISTTSSPGAATMNGTTDTDRTLYFEALPRTSSTWACSSRRTGCVRSGHPGEPG